MRTLKKEVWPYQIFVKIPLAENIHELSKLDNWCANSVGRRSRDWYSHSIGYQKNVYAFKDKEAILIFKLTWGNYGIG